MSPTTTAPPKKRRNHRTFTVRALLTATALVAVLVALWMAVRPKTYVAALILVKNMPAGSVIAPAKFDGAEFRAFRAEQVELLRSKAILGGAIKQPSVAKLSIVQGKSDPVAWLQANLQTDYLNDSEILRVRLASSQPEEAVQVVNAVVQFYFEKCVWADAKKQRLHRDELQQIYDQRTLDASLRRKELLGLVATPGDGNAPGEKDAELARREALAREAFLQWEHAKIVADAPPRVLMGEEAMVQK